jgi:hypothetical protein
VRSVGEDLIIRRRIGAPGIRKHASATKASIAPNYVDGTMFANDNEFYLYGLASLISSSNEIRFGVEGIRKIQVINSCFQICF